MSKATQKERSTIAQLQAVAKTWPDTLWLFSASGRLYVMQKDANGKRAITHDGGVDPDYCLATIPIENDGGDW